MKKSARMMAWMLTLLLACTLVAPAFAQGETRTLRVGYIGYDHFIQQGEDGSFTGYGVDFLNKIAGYANLEYEYVYTSWEDSLELLRNHELDLVCTAKFTAERNEIYDYSTQSFGQMEGVLYTARDADLYYEDFAHLNGTEIAFLRGSLNAAFFDDYAQRNDFTYTPVYYDSDADMVQALEDGKVAAVATERMAVHDGLKLIGTFTSQPFYLMSYQGNDFMADIDWAMSEILTADSSYKEDLFNQYYADQFPELNLTREESAYIQALLNDRLTTTGSAALKVPVAVGLNPLAYLDATGQLCGIRVDLLKQISEISGIPFDLVALDATDTAYDYGYFRDNGFDLMMVEDNAVNRAYEGVEGSGMRFTTSMDSLQKVMIAKKGFVLDTQAAYRVAYVTGSESFSKLITGWYPNVELVGFESIDDCFDAVKQGKADILIYNQYLSERQLLRPQYDTLMVVPGISFSDSAMLSPVIYKNGSYKELGADAIDPYLDDPRLISILNKAIAVIDADTVNDIVIKNTIGTYSAQLPLQDFWYRYKAAIVLAGVSLVVAFGALIAVYSAKRRNLEKVSAINLQLEDSVMQAEHANAAKSTFLARMSHEIRTPMNAIVGLTAIAKRNLLNPEKTEECLGKIETSSKILLNIINDVLDMSAIESDKLKIAHEKFDLKEILNGITMVYYTQCKQKGVTLEVLSADVSHEILMGDALRVNQILLNLISNAYKFTPEGKSIRVTLSETTTRDNTAFIRIVVADTGIGMSEEMQSRLFHSFEQESAETARKHGGSGLGLSITKNLVELMHGSIAVQSKKGEGTTFTVDLPFEIAQDAVKIDTEKLKSVHALVVDDDQHAREYTAIVLERLGVQYEIAESGERAVEMLTEKYRAGMGFDICLIDWKMPGLDGVDVTRKIREMFDEDTVIIIASAYDLSEVEDEAKEAGANLFVTKPLFQSTVFNVLMSLRGGTWTGETAQETDYDFGGRRVLLAEDNALNTEIAVDLLNLVNIEVDTAENGQIAVERFNASAPGTYGAILMDIQMPVMDGYEAAKAIRAGAHPEAATIPILAMTANAFNEDVAAALSAGMNGHIAKPIDTAVLYKTLKEKMG